MSALPLLASLLLAADPSLADLQRFPARHSRDSCSA
jgi:hypothetical protein